MGATHTIGGVNYADVWHVQLQLIGWFLVVAGAFTLLLAEGILWRKKVPIKLETIIEG